MKDTIKPKSDQKNYDDLIAGPITIKITKVTTSGSREQPVSVFFEGDDGKPYKPCLSMRRVLIKVWGDQEALYIGRSMTLYGDEKVKWAGAEVGGIRISHMSDMTEDMTMSLTANKQQRKPYTVKVLKGVGPTKDPLEDLKKEFEEKVALIPEESGKSARDYLAKNSTAQDYAGVLKQLDKMIEENPTHESPEETDKSEGEKGEKKQSEKEPETESEESPAADSGSSPEEDLF
jgi:hypothetical protein